MGGHGYFLGLLCDTESAAPLRGVVVRMWGSQLPTSQAVLLKYPVAEACIANSLRRFIYAIFVPVQCIACIDHAFCCG